MALKPFPIKSVILSFSIVLILAQTTVAQFGRRASGDYNSWEIGFSGGVSQFRNSINPNSDATYHKFNYWNADFNPAMTLSIVKRISPKFNAEFEWLTTKLSGSWNPNNGYPIPSGAIPYPNPFKTGINQFNLMLVANLNKIIVPNLTGDKWYLFVKGGVGAAILKEYSGLFPYNKPGNGFEYAILYGGGLSYQINEKIKLKIGANWLTVKSDRLDGIHTARPLPHLGSDDNSVFYFNVSECYLYPYIGMTYGLGQVMSKAHFIRSSGLLWYKKPIKRYKRR